MNIKAQKFDRYLKTNDLNFFEMIDEEDAVIFRTELPICGQEMVTVIVFDDSVYNMLQIKVVGEISNPRKKDMLLEFVNEVNAKYKHEKYFITEKNSIQYTATYLSDEEYFDSEMMKIMLGNAMRNIEEQYSKFMKIMWS